MIREYLKCVDNCLKLSLSHAQAVVLRWGNHHCFHGTISHTKLHLLLRAGRGAEYCDQPVCVSVCVRVSVRVSVCPRAYLWNRWTDLHEILCADPMWPWLGPPPVALRYVMYFRF